MIAVIAGAEAAPKGLMQLALEHGGFETRNAAAPDDAARILETHGSTGCVLTIEASRLSGGAGDRTWASFLSDHPTLSAVVTTSTPGDDAAQRATDAPHRLLLQSPFDAAAVVAGVRRAVQQPAAGEDEPIPRVRRAEQAKARPPGARPSAAG